MAATILNVVKGDTVPLVWQLLNAGSAINLTGASVALVVTDENNASVTMGGTFVIETAATGRVQYTPASADFNNAPQTLKVRVKVTNGSQVSHYPNAEHDLWRTRLA